MTNAETENVIGSTKMQVNTAEVQPWPEIAQKVKPRNRQWLWPLLSLTICIGIIAFASTGALGDLFQDDYFDLANNICMVLALLTGLATLLLLFRLLVNLRQHVLRENEVELQGLGDVCVIRNVQKKRRSIRVPEQLKSMKVIAVEGGFERKRGLARLWLADGTERLADGLLRNCSGLASVHLPERLKAVPPSLMEGCTRLQAVVIPMAAESIGERAFAGCRQLKDVYITAGTTAIAGSAFAGCPNVLFHVQEGSDAEQFAREHRINYSYH